MTDAAQPGPFTTRHATLEDLAALLTEQQARKVDIVASPSALRSQAGMLIIAGSEPVLTADGVDLVDGTFRPTAVFDEGISDKPWQSRCWDAALAETWTRTQRARCRPTVPQV